MSDRPTILVTGAGGYIGSHCIIVLLEQNYNVVGIDNFVNSVKGAQSKCSVVLYKQSVPISRNFQKCLKV